MRRQNRIQITTNLKPGGHSDNTALLRQYNLETNPSRPVRPSPLTASTLHGLPLELVDRLRSFPLFTSAPDSFLVAIAKYLRPQLHQPHDHILTEGQESRAMYWLVRGTVRVTSRDGESTYAELKAGSFFGEIGILMDIPRTATITASTRALVVRLNKEDLQKELPNFPTVERAIRDEAVERLAILERKKNESRFAHASPDTAARKRSMHDLDAASPRKRKSPSPAMVDAHTFGSLAQPGTTIRNMIKEMPLFAELPPHILHFLGLNANHCTFAPFTDIITQGSHGRDVFFLTTGHVEVVTHAQLPHDHVSKERRSPPVPRVRARLKPGQYFGEVTSLSLSPLRTATVRSISRVECLCISTDILDRLWQMCPPLLKEQVETEARRRLDAAAGTPLSESALDSPFASISPSSGTPTVVLTDSAHDRRHAKYHTAFLQPAEPLDPDPFFGSEFDASLPRSRRSSLAPPSPVESPLSPSHARSVQSVSPSRYKGGNLSPSASSLSPTTMRPPIFRASSTLCRGHLPDPLLVRVLGHLDLISLLRIRRVSSHWHKLASTHPSLLQNLNLSLVNRKLTDSALTNCIAPFVNNRTHHVNINNCYHITDEGFSALASACSDSVRSWHMRSVWDVNGQCILDLVNSAPHLEELDLSNCRKVGDALLSRIVSCRAMKKNLPISSSAASNIGLGIAASAATTSTSAHSAQSTQSAPQTGFQTTHSPLKRLTLSYCKHIQDRSLAHVAQYACERLESVDLTRCTSVSDQAFAHWAMHNFSSLTRLVLADCTYLTDQAVVGIVGAARNLRMLDLVCFSLSLSCYVLFSSPCFPLLSLPRLHI